MQFEGKRKFNQTGNGEERVGQSVADADGVCGSCLFNVAWGGGQPPKL